MSEPFLGQIMMGAFNFPPKGYAACNGASLPISQNQALYSLLGTMYGGDGRTTFALPDLQGRTPIHIGGGYTQGESTGSREITLSTAQMPGHTHVVNGRAEDGDAASPHDAVPASTPSQLYHDLQSTVAMSAQMVSNAGGGQPHENMAPYTVINHVIAVQGIYPSRN